MECGIETYIYIELLVRLKILFLWFISWNCREFVMYKVVYRMVDEIKRTWEEMVVA
jgi:hypothetical protein